MDLLTVGLLIILGILVGIILKLLLRGQHGDLPNKLEASLNERFITFQSEIHKELSNTRQEIVRSKDLISNHTIKTIETVKDMGETIHKIVQQQEEAHQLGKSLKDLLQAPKLRGNYGEAILEEMLERVLPQNIWERQYLIDEGKQVDAIVKMKDVIIPIDAKFPRDNYQKYLESSLPDEKKRYWKDHETAVKNQIKDIRTKYVKPEKGTSDFALMFIPSEAIYYETIAEKNYCGEPSKIYEYALENKVIPVSPNTFYAFLQVIVIGIRNVEIIKSVKQLQEGLSMVQKSFGLFYKKYEEMGKWIDKAREAYRVGDTHITRYKDKLDSTLQLEELQEETAGMSGKMVADEKQVS